MDIHIQRKDMTVKVIENDKVVKAQELEPEEFKELMGELCGESLEAVRLATRLFKVKSFKFKDVKIWNYLKI